MRWLVIPLLALLVACNSPDYRYFGVDPVAVVIDGRTYQVYVRRDAGVQPSVHVIRMGYARRAEHVAILQAMIQAAETASGCAVLPGQMQGDSGVMTARLRC